MRTTLERAAYLWRALYVVLYLHMWANVEFKLSSMVVMDAFEINRESPSRDYCPQPHMWCDNFVAGAHLTSSFSQACYKSIKPID